MAEKQQLKQHQQQQQRLALLALLADRPQPTGQCLKDETLAALVEGKLAHKETEQCLAHLATCEQCLSLWLQLDQYWQSEKTSRPGARFHRFITRPRVLTAAGSLLAVAASIAVFLQITLTPNGESIRLFLDPMEQEQSQPAPVAKPVIEQSKGTPLLSSPAPQKEKTRNEEKDSAQPRKRSLGKTTEPEATVPAPALSPPSPRATARPSASLEHQMQDMGAMETQHLFGAPQARTAAAPPYTLDTWLEMVHQGCNPPKNSTLLLAAVDYGHRLLTTTPPEDLPPALRKKIEAIVHRLETQADPSEAHHCSTVLELVEQIRREKP